jgi:predicted signal transduction protein with EAL and GGDEF domain
LPCIKAPDAGAGPSDQDPPGILNASITAEGIETPQQARRLRELGCDNAQGFYFARPLDFEEAMRKALHKPHGSHRDAA